jgi:transketolase
MDKKWDAFGWDTYQVNGHSEEMLDVLNKVSFDYNSRPKIIIADTIKGNGVSFIEGHGPWHHKVPTKMELKNIKRELLGKNEKEY